MTRLIALYPRAWRDRYETEFRALMAERPQALGDRVDIVLGAIDARLHPQNPGAPERPRQPSRPATLTGILAAIAGLGWSAWIGLILRDFRGWGSGTPETADLMIALSAAGFLALTAATVAFWVTFGSSMRPVGLLGGVLAGFGFALTAFGGGMTLLVALIGVAVLAWSMAGRVIPGWLAAGWIGTVVLACSTFIAFVAGNGRDVGLIALGVPFGIAWIVVGAAIAVRRTPARVDAWRDVG
jgi:hypothetical protein